MAQFPHHCAGPSVPCHSNALAHGRGVGAKTDDFLHAACCPEAHDYLDGRKGGWTKEEKRAEWERAYIATQRFYWTQGWLKVA